MNTLREIGEFVGIPQGSLEVAWLYAPFGLQNFPTDSLRIARLSMVSLLVTYRERPASMRAIIQALQNLTPITLEAQIVGDRSGEEPFNTVVRLNASGGIIWSTYVEYRPDGVPSDRYPCDSSGGDFSNTLPHGNFQVVVGRLGISNTGYVSLEKILGTITVWQQYVPPAPPQQQSPSQQSGGGGGQTSSGPSISVSKAPSPIDKSMEVTISGKGFDSKENVTIHIKSSSKFGYPTNVETPTKADIYGVINAKITLFCDGGMTHEFTAVGESGKNANTKTAC
jgi:hypothetical protein